MNAAGEYRKKAAEFRAKAVHESDPRLRTEWESLGAAYLRLAEQADHNARMDVSYEPPLKPTRA